MLLPVLVFAPALVRAEAEPVAERPAAEAAAAEAIPSELQPALMRAEFLGRQLYLHDRAAWLATDAAHADPRMRERMGRIGGWVTEPTAHGIRVIFVSKDQTPARVFEVEVDERDTLSEAVVASPEPLRAEHLTQLHGRALAVSQPFMACGRSYNAVAMPSAEGVRVYLMPAFPRKGVFPLGGYHRYDLDQAGETVLASRSFSNTCIELDETAPLGPPREDGFTPVGMMFTHVLDPQPTEIHVFVSLYAKRAFMISTVANKRLWKIEQGRIGAMPPIDAAIPTEANPATATSDAADNSR
jgi:hypothetical protein